MADVTLKYKGATIGELSENGSKTIETAGKYCEADILMEYVKPESLAEIEEGTFKLQSALASYNWQHNLGELPTIIIVYPENINEIRSSCIVGGATVYANSLFLDTPLKDIINPAISQKTGIYTQGGSTISRESVAITSLWYINATENQISLSGNAAMPVPANVTFKWKAILIK